MFYVMKFVGGHSSENEAVVASIDRLERCLDRIQPREPAAGSFVLGVAFHVPGPLLGTDFQGIRKEGFSRRHRELNMEVAVPIPLEAGTEDAFVGGAMLRAMDLAEELLRARSVDWSTAHLRETLRRLRGCFDLPSAADSLPAALSPGATSAASTTMHGPPGIAGSGVDEGPWDPSSRGMLIIQLPTRGQSPTAADVAVRHQLEDLLEGALNADGAGGLDGGDIGGGVMNIYVQPWRRQAADTVLHVLERSGRLAEATVVLRFHNEGADEEESYMVLWPEGYTGTYTSENEFREQSAGEQES